MGARPDLCERADIRRYPTWTIGGARYEGVLSLAELARAARFANGVVLGKPIEGVK